MTQDVTPLGTLIDELQAKRLIKDRIAAELKEVEAEIDEYRFRIRQTMDAVGLETASGHDLSVSVLSLIHISEPTRQLASSRMPSSA